MDHAGPWAQWKQEPANAGGSGVLASTPGRAASTAANAGGMPSAITDAASRVDAAALADADAASLDVGAAAEDECAADAPSRVAAQEAMDQHPRSVATRRRARCGCMLPKHSRFSRIRATTGASTIG